MTLEERFINYTTFDTQAAEDATTTPSTPAKQLPFAAMLRKEMEEVGLADITLDEKGYLYATLPANVDDTALPTIGFIAHYDTAPDASGKNVRARIIKNYDGSTITLSPGIVTDPERFPELLAHIGEDLIVSDGTTLLGADDKAGIAEIMEAMVYLMAHPEIPHGTIRVAFNPDEEIGMGAQHFDVGLFNCDYAYTMDGGDLGELEYECFNAAGAKITIHGVSVHTGYAKGRMVNAGRLAAELLAALPSDETPESTDGYDGFYHLVSTTATTEQAKMYFIIRDHDKEKFRQRKALMQSIVDKLNDKYGQGTVEANIYDQYYNMKEIIDQHYHVVQRALDAFKASNVPPRIQPIRGGTDGAQLSFRGLPCPNIFAGGVAFHGPHEFISIQVMHSAVDVIVALARR